MEVTHNNNNNAADLHKEILIYVACIVEVVCVGECKCIAIISIKDNIINSLYIWYNMSLPQYTHSIKHNLYKH